MSSATARRQSAPDPTLYDPEWTIASALVRAASGVNPDPDAGMTFLADDGSETRLRFAEVLAETQRRGRHLLALGLVKGDRVGFVVPDPMEFVLSFLGATSVGLVPVPLYPPLGMGKIDSYVRDTARTLGIAGARVLLTQKKVQPILWSLVDAVPSLERLVCTESLTGPAPKVGLVPDVTPDDVAFLQFTSGSTAAPKGVVVTHRSLGANAWSIMVPGLQTDIETDVAVSWLPLYHDMGLIGFVISPLVIPISAVFMPTMSFIKHPTRWVEALSRHRGTITFAPNFAYGLATRRTSAEKVAKLDLSQVRVLGAGAEPNHPGTLRGFVEHFAPAGLRPEAMMPVYGMAEATLAMAFSRLDQPLRVDRIDAATYQADGRAIPVTGGDIEPDARRVAGAEGSLEHVSCGFVFPDHDIVIMDEEGRELPERTVGEIVFRGASVAAGYFENEEATARAFREDGLRTGDLGYLAGGELFVTGRKKDLIILNGRNYDPQSIEWVAAEVDGVRRGNVVAFSRRGEATEELIVVAEVRRGTDEEAVTGELRRRLREDLALNPADVLLCPPGTLPKTTSGKLQRARAAQQYLAGTLGTEGVRTLGERGARLTVAKHVARSMVSRVRHSVRHRASTLVETIRQVTGPRPRA
ncbi:MAG: fatty acyl-AMP ligase [Deltaproteobacteria bacterium]|nr:fatty acyl-AMP ligase [Deltaproteobacteria bacterium]